MIYKKLLLKHWKSQIRGSQRVLLRIIVFTFENSFKKSTEMTNLYSLVTVATAKHVPTTMNPNHNRKLLGGAVSTFGNIDI